VVKILSFSIQVSFNGKGVEMTKAARWVYIVTLAGLLVFLGSGASLVKAISTAPTLPTDRISPDLRQKMSGLGSNTRLRVIVTLTSSPNYSDVENSVKNLPFERRQQAVETILQANARPSQANLRARLDQLQAAGTVSDVVSFWIFNGISLNATPAVIKELANRPEIASIVSDQVYITAEPVSGVIATATTPNSNISLLNAPALWALGFKGQGVVVANMDTGVDGSHPDLASKFRGGANSWFDPYGQNVTPTDNAGASTGHGTATMSLMVGGNLSGHDIGMAPGAKWIAAKIFDNSGNATATAIHQAFQWILDPDGNPATPDAPQVLSDSWGDVNPGCDLTFEPDVKAILAAGILPVFSAGNFGPASSTDTSPGNFPESFPVGAIDNASNVASFSSRGPTSCGRTTSATLPLVVAPGVSVPVAALGGLYTSMSGTSFSAPETAGGLALLLSAFPGLTPAKQASTLTSSAVDLGAVGPDNVFGYGRLDILAAYNSLKPVLNNTVKIFLPIVDR
jgi:serine protease AprX